MKKYLNIKLLVLLFVLLSIVRIDNLLIAQQGSQCMVHIYSDLDYTGLVQYKSDNGSWVTIPTSSGESYLVTGDAVHYVQVLNSFIYTNNNGIKTAYIYKSWSDGTNPSPLTERNSENPFNFYAALYGTEWIKMNYETGAVLTVSNDYGGGTVLIDGASYPSGTDVAVKKGNHTISTTDRQSYGGYIRIFKHWGDDGNAPISRTVNVQGNTQYTTTTHKEFNVSFTDNNNNNIVYNGTVYSSPTSTFPVEQNTSITVTGSNSAYTSNHVIFDITGWSNGSTTYPTTFTPTDHGSFASVYTGTKAEPVTVTDQTGNLGGHLKIGWTLNPNSGVTTYKIYRSYYHEYGDYESAARTNIATVSAPTNLYTDMHFWITDTADCYVTYDVTSIYNPSGLESDQGNSVTHYAGVDIDHKNGKSPDKTNNALTIADNDKPTKYEIGNYPNPFNPTTTFEVKLPNSENVILKVYDVAGKEVATLLNRYMVAGTYSVKFGGNNLPSGIYFYRIMAGSFNKMGKIMLLK